MEDQVFYRHEELQRRHNEEVLPLLDTLYQEAGVLPRATDLIGFGAGPGSFTGVRIAASVAQGIAMASGCPVVPMAGSEILLRSALSALNKPSTVGASSASSNKIWLTVVPSRGEAYYLALYNQSCENAEHVVTAFHEDRLYTQPPEWLATWEPSWGLVGPRPSWLPGTITFEQVEDPAPNAQSMVQPVRQVHSLGRSKAAEHALPIYVEGDSPWKKVTPVRASNP